MDKQVIKDFAAKEIAILQVIHDEVASTWVLSDAEVMAVTVAIYQKWGLAYGTTRL